MMNPATPPTTPSGQAPLSKEQLEGIRLAIENGLYEKDVAKGIFPFALRDLLREVDRLRSELEDSKNATKLTEFERDCAKGLLEQEMAAPQSVEEAVRKILNTVERCLLSADADAAGCRCNDEIATALRSVLEPVERERDEYREVLANIMTKLEPGIVDNGKNATSAYCDAQYVLARHPTQRKNKPEPQTESIDGSLDDRKKEKYHYGSHDPAIEDKI